MFPVTSTRRSNFPRRPNRQLRNDTIPEDLLAEGRNLFTQIQFVGYSSSTVSILNNAINLPFSRFPLQSTGVVTPVGGMALPIPKKINEAQVLSWSEVSATKTGVAFAAGLARGGLSTALQGAFGSLGQVGSALLGVQVNPYLFMVFQQPNFKDFSFSWTFAPKNARESQALSDIITQFKGNSLPTLSGLVMDYPNVALIRLLPNDVFGNLLFKPCVVTSVIVDYTGAGPSFFKSSPNNSRSNGAPTVVNLTVNFKEIQLWDRNEILSSPVRNLSAFESPDQPTVIDPNTGAQLPAGTPQPPISPFQGIA